MVVVPGNRPIAQFQCLLGFQQKKKLCQILLFRDDLWALLSYAATRGTKIP